MALSYAFGGDTGTTYEDLKRRQAFAEALWARGGLGAPKTAIEGINSAAQSITGALLAKKLSKQLKGQQDEFGMLFNGALSGLGAQQPTGGDVQSPPPRNPDQQIADDTMRSLGKPEMAGGGRDAFIQAMMPHAMRVSQATGLDPRLVIAQAAQETGWGKHAPGNNYFGIKSHGKAGGQNLATNEVVNGQTVRVNDSFRAYGGMGDSADGYASFLKENPRYRSMLSAPDLDGQLAALGKSGYATDPNYAASVGSIARSIPLPQGEQARATGGVNPMLLSLVSDPRATDAQRNVLQMLVQQQIQNADPMRQLQMQKLQSDIASGGDLPTSFRALQLQALEGGLKPGTPEYQNFMRNGGGDPATFRALDMQAKASGFAPGSPQYADFMATRGAGLAAGASQSAKNSADIYNGGVAAQVVAQGAAQGKANAVSASELQEMERNMPGLLQVAEKLNSLAEKATYTFAGQGRDMLRKQLGLPPNEAAIARAEYIATVDNQVLPLLRQTFGAAFTAKEGDTLRATLGDPNKSPEEKKAVLNAFIEQKKRDLLARGGSLPSQPLAPPAAQNSANSDFSNMTIEQVGQVDIGSLNEQQMDALEARMKELGL